MSQEQNRQKEYSVTTPEEVFIEIKEPPLSTRVIKRTLFYTVGAVMEPQEPRYSAICVFLSLCATFVGGMLMKKCLN